ncbi:MAG: hypothetical protein M3081_10300 [Gemmatimonadota bacterium]|nr:hypothetical protein [Gemmatimonadota bacterium]
MPANTAAKHDGQAMAVSAEPQKSQRDASTAAAAPQVGQFSEADMRLARP